MSLRADASAQFAEMPSEAGEGECSNPRCGEDDEAVAFYQKYGFVLLTGVEKRLFVAMSTAADMFK